MTTFQQEFNILKNKLSEEFKNKLLHLENEFNTEKRNLENSANKWVSEQTENISIRLKSTEMDFKKFVFLLNLIDMINIINRSYLLFLKS
jgi:hypothetical protein